MQNKLYQQMYALPSLCTQILRKISNARFVILKYKSILECQTLLIGTPVPVKATNVPSIISYERMQQNLRFNPLIINEEIFPFDSYVDEYILLFNPQNNVQHALVKYFEGEELLIIIAFNSEQRMLQDMQKITQFWQQYELIPKIHQQYQCCDMLITFSEGVATVNHKTLQYVHRIDTDPKNALLFVLIDPDTPDFEFILQELVAISKRFSNIHVILELSVQDQCIKNFLKTYWITHLNLVKKVNNETQSKFQAVFVYQNHKVVFSSTDEINLFIIQNADSQVKQVDEDRHFLLFDNCTILFGHLITQPLKQRRFNFFCFCFLLKEFYTRYEKELESLSIHANIMVFVYQENYSNQRFQVIRDDKFFENVRTMMGGGRRQFNFLYDEIGNLIEEQGTVEFIVKYVREKAEESDEFVDL
ncbi:Conserved_hypothetical protein [Hexamita inflata]|uniref:Uncharacterized protein n=1 Tax=Hexamita inflata TaxID=28002 RepID=A0AA86TDI1_9EUKA|nr:Conserved hypothetical protein [Hexamita inflata]